MVFSQCSESIKVDEATLINSPLPWRLHRLQLLRQWLLYFSNVVHDHFVTTALLPFHHNMENLLDTEPHLSTLLSGKKHLI